MAKFALKLAPPSRWDERPAATSLDASVDWASLKTTGLGWKEAWVESVLARFPKELLVCGRNEHVDNAIGLQQVADIDVVVIVPERALLLVGVKQGNRSGIGKTTSQLARILNALPTLLGEPSKYPARVYER